MISIWKLDSCEENSFDSLVFFCLYLDGVYFFAKYNIAHGKKNI